MLVDMHGMSRKDLKDGIVAYGQSSLHAVACVTAKILNEDGDVKYKAYPNCTITNGLSRSVSTASQTDPFTLKEENLAVIVKTKGPYHYLYFPDDGSNTQHHFGNQQFMFDGANASEDKIVNEVIDELVKRLEEI